MKKITRAFFVLIIGFFVVVASSCLSKGELAEHLVQSGMNAIIKNRENIVDSFDDFTPEQEYYIGRSVAAQILTKYDLYESKMMNKYLNYICATLVANTEEEVVPYKDYSIGIIDTDEVNAFATSGGHILISKGLINCAQSEDALAAVIAHEIAHIQFKHNIKAIMTNRKSEAFSKVGVSFVKEFTGGVIDDVLDLFDDIITEGISTLVDSGYSQVNEFDADKRALAIMAAAGYRPEAMNDMLLVLEENTDTQEGWGKTHPTPKKRMDNLKKQYNKYNVKDTTESRTARFLAVMSNFN